MSEYIVRVGPKYLTYRYASPLEIGDEVLLPPTPYSDGPWKATVTALGRGDYDGPVISVLCRVAPDRAVTP
jgi:hypothetical protein